MSNRIRDLQQSFRLSLWAVLLVACAAQPSPAATEQTPTAAPPLSTPTGQSTLALTAAARAAPALSAASDCAPEHKLCREEDFANAHRAEASLNGKWIQVAGQRAYLSLPKSTAAPMPGIVLLHTARGLNTNIQLWSDRLAEEGYAVLAVDFYEGKVASTDPEALALRDQANAKADRNVAVAKAAYALLFTNPHVQARRVALVGWSFGGAWATYLSTELPDVAAVVTYAGNAVGDVETAKRIKAPILMIRGSRDQLFEAAKAAKFEERLKTAQKQVELVGVDGGHALADPTRDDYSATGDWVAFLRVRDFLKAHLAH